MAVVVAPVAGWIAGAVGSVAGTVLAAAGVTGVAGIGALSTIVSAAYTVSEIALYAGMMYAVDAVQKPKIKPIGSELTFNADPAYPREMLVGEQLVGGSMVARYSHKSNRNNAHFVIQVADHPCEALLSVLGEGRLVRGTPLTHGARTEITAYSNSDGPRVWMTWHDGRPGQTADTNLIAASLEDPEVVAGNIKPWTSEHVGAGCAYVHVEVQYDSDILTSIPSWLFMVRGASFYDRRKDSTAGGSGAHRHSDPSTWEYTTNAAVVWDHWALGYKVEDDDLAFGLGLSRTELPYAQFAATANLADEDVATGTGEGAATIKRYEINGVLSSATYFEDQIEDMQLQMSARIVDLGGRIGIIGAEERVSVVSLDDQDLIADEPFQFAPYLPFSDLYGSVSGNFRDPANNFQATPYTKLSTAYAQLPDGGEAQAVSLDLPLEINARRADRLASAWLQRESIQPRMIARFGPKAWKLEPGDWFDYSDTGLQIENELFEVIDIQKADDFTVTITARAINPDFLAFDNSQDVDLGVPPDMPPADLYLETPEFTPTATSISGGGAIEPAIAIALGDISSVTREIVIEVRKWDGTDFVGPSLFFQAHRDQVNTVLRQGLQPATIYRLRLKARAGSRESAWSDWSGPITLSATYVVPLASGAAPGSDLASDLAKLATATNYFPGFTFVGGHGDIVVEANVLAASDIRVSAGYIDHPTLGEITVTETTFNTAWGVFYAPPNGYFGIAWSQEPVEDRFLNAVGNGHFFPFAYVDGELMAFGLDRNNGESFTPELTDMVVARADKPAQTDSSDLSVSDGIEAVETFVRDTVVVNTKIEQVQAAVADAAAGVVSVASALADAEEARALQYIETTAAVGEVDAKTLAIMSALASPDGATAIIGLEANAAGVVTGLKIISVATGHSTPISVMEFTAALFKFHGASIFDGSITANLLDPGSIAAIGYVFPTTGGISTGYATKATKSVTTDGGPVEIEFAALFEQGDPLLPVYMDGEFGVNRVRVYAKILRGSTEIVPEVQIAAWTYLHLVEEGPISISADVQQGRLVTIDSPPAGTYTYTVQLKCSHAGSDFGLYGALLKNSARLLRIVNPSDGPNDVDGP